MRAFMGITEYDEIPAPVSEPGVASVFWVQDGDSRELCPDWRLNWEPNAVGWGKEVADAVQKRGAVFNPEANADELANLSISHILNELHTVFNDWKASYKVHEKGKEAVNEALARNRMTSRKTNVCVKLYNLLNNLPCHRKQLKEPDIVQRLLARQKQSGTLYSRPRISPRMSQ
jgi:hypothetical protein